MTLAVAIDSKMLEVTVWTRGVTLAKEARDTATLLAKAGKTEGKHVQSFDNYVDLPDRIGVPVKSYARISPEPIETFYEYENYRPDVVVLAEETLVKGNDILKGAKPGCVVVINTARKPETLLKWILPKENLKNVKAVACINANVLGAGVMLTFDGTEGAGDDTKIGAGVGAAIAGAVAKATGCVKLDSLVSIAENKTAVKQGYDTVTVLPL
ncbi:oxalate oxidoreductase subunit delta [Acetonema longum]|uniref:Pyruvate ferredoxin/flavodoxin oxidoreductase, delta subunit n=1 Tax=Acetonema longum DSM 6540 TaxID=1009370 RepID=F7NP46_9FIRM|nr:2-oxoacid:acceptor oxidoreductase family protein [Acetonema longum]EGO62169.1 pyruvate ferredoxin/flavodoxin oxidoreductase, delta subunit [Acetonema longum DSM 6540]